jgi:hypothetical protein
VIDKRWLILIALALVIMLTGCVMIRMGEPGAGALLLVLSFILVVFGVMQWPDAEE